MRGTRASGRSNTGRRGSKKKQTTSTERHLSVYHVNYRYLLIMDNYQKEIRFDMVPSTGATLNGFESFLLVTSARFKKEKYL